jgi:hypothetical protein
MESWVEIENSFCSGGYCTLTLYRTFQKYNHLRFQIQPKIEKFAKQSYNLFIHVIKFVCLFGGG